MRTRRIWPAIGVGLLVLALAALPWGLFGERLQQHVVTQIRSISGLDSEIGATPRISLFPRPKLVLETVAIHDSEGAIRIESPKATADLRMLSLLTGHLELAAITLRRPTIFIDTDAKPLRHSGLIAKASSGSLSSDSGDDPRMGELTIEAGLVFARSRASGFETLIEDVTGTLAWPTLASPATFTGLATWRGMAGHITGSVERPAMLLRGETSDAQLNFLSPTGSLSFDGHLVGGTNPQVSGRFEAAAPSLDKLLRIFHLEMPLSGTVQSFALSGDLRASAREFSLTGANLKADTNNFEGNLALNRSEGRLHLAGTLATELLSLDSITSGLVDFVPTQNAVDEPPPDLDRLARRLARDLAHGEIDLRISAANVRWRHLTFTDAALSVLSSGNDVEVSLAEAHAYRGMIKGKVRIGSNARGFDVRASGGFIKTDIALLLADLMGSARLSGTGSGLFNLDTNGATLGQLRENLDGHGQIGIRAGELAGIDLGQTLERAEKKPMALAFERSVGRTPFDLASANINVSGGVLTLSEGVFSGPSISITLAGKVAMADGSGSLKAWAAPGSAAAGSPRMAFNISGPWSNPSFRPDLSKGPKPPPGLEPTVSQAPSEAPASVDE